MKKKKSEKIKTQSKFQIRWFGIPRAAGEFKEPQASACAIASTRLLCLALLGGVLLGGQFACAPAKLLDPPAGWPATWNNRKLYHTPNAYIYAGSATVARESDELAARVWREFEDRTERAGQKGLILVTDIDEQPVIPNYRAYCDLCAKRDAAARGVVLTDEDLERRYETICAAMEDQGIDPETDLLMTSVSLTGQELSGLLGFPTDAAQSVDWAVAVPTSRLIQQAVQENMQGEMNKREVGLIAQVLLEPVMVFEKRVRNVKASVSRDVELFRNHAKQQAEWNESEREQQVQAYMQRKLAESLRPVLTLLADVIEFAAEPIKPLLPHRDEPQSSEAESEGTEQ